MYELLKKNKQVRILWGTLVLSSIGGLLAVFIQSYLVFNITQSLSAMSFLLLSYSVPSIAVNLFGGVLVDKFNKLKIMQFTLLGRLVAFSLPLIAYFSGNLEPYYLFIASFITGICDTLFKNCNFTIIPELVDKTELISVNSLLEVTNKIIWIISPSIAGILVQNFDAGVVLILMVCSLIAANIIFSKIPRDIIQENLKKSKKSFWPSLIEGWEFFLVKPVLISLSLIIVIANLGIGAIQPLLMPYVLDILKSSSYLYGIFVSSFSIGMIIGGYLLNKFKKKRKDGLILIAIISTGLTIIFMGISSSIYLSIALGIINGIGIMIFSIITSTYYQIIVPLEFRGRIYSIRRLISEIPGPLGIFLTGIFSSFLELQTIFIYSGLIVLLTIPLILKFKFNLKEVN